MGVSGEALFQRVGQDLATERRALDHV